MRTGSTTRGVPRFGSLALAMIAALLLPPGASGQAAPRTAGKISKLLPVGHVVRERKSLEAKSDMQVLWGDLVRTERGGRVRVELEDGSILNVGSDSSLLIQKHDAQTQQTELELEYGRVRANAVKIARPGGSFNLRTKTAVAGIVGTEEYLEASAIVTTVIALGGGQVAVSSTDPRFPEPILLNPGEAVTLVAARRPGPKRAATAEELIKAAQDTEVEGVASLSPGQTLAGRSFDATVSGKGLSHAKALSFSQPGIQVQTRGNITATKIPVSISVDARVPPGTYTLTIDRPEGPARCSLVVTTQQAIQASQAAASALEPPSSFNLSGIQGVKFALDASSTRTASGTSIVSYQWTILNTPLRSNDSTFTLNTSLLAPGNYTVQLVVVNDRGQTATRQYPLTVTASEQPQEIIGDLAIAYQSLQPSQFLKYFDEENFRNYPGFAAAIEDSFRNQLQSATVFKQGVGCTVVQEQDQAACQAVFTVTYATKAQPTQLVTTTQHITLRFGRSNAGWKIVDYSPDVPVPNAGTTGLSTASAVFAAASSVGTSSSPSFQIINLQVVSNDLPLGGSVTGTFQVSPMGGFNGSISFTGQGQIPVTVQFSPNPSGPSGTVSFTVIAPTTPPTGFSGFQPFTLTITGQDTTRTVTASTNVTLVLESGFTLSLSPATSSSSPAPVTQNSTLQLGVTVVPGLGFAGTVFVDFPNLPAGFQVSPGNVPAGMTVTFPLQVTSAAALGPAFITVRGTFGTDVIRTAALFVVVQAPPATKLLAGTGLQATKISSQPAVTSSSSGTTSLFLTASPATTESAPVLLQPDSTTTTTTSTFVNLFVNSDGSATGTVNLSVAGVADGVTASLTPSAVDVTGGALQMVQLRLRGVSGGTLAGTQRVQVVATSGSFSATTTVFIATQTGSAAGLSGSNVPRVLQVRSPGGEPGSYTPVTILGEGLAGIREVVTDSPEISARIEPGGKPTLIQLSVFVKPRATQGTHTLMLTGPEGSIPVAFLVKAGELANDRLEERRGLRGVGEQSRVSARQASIEARETRSAAEAPPSKSVGDSAGQQATASERRAPDSSPILRVEEFAMSPARPKPGEAVTFTVGLRNDGTQAVEGAMVEFDIAGTAIRQQEQVSLGPGESQRFEFEWQAKGEGRLVPRVVIDPEHRIGGLDRSSSARSLEPFEIPSEAAAPKVGTGAAGILERAQARLEAGGCIGFRFAFGNEQACGAGADFELRASADGRTVTIQAEGVRGLGYTPLGQVAASAEAGSAESATLQPGATYVVRAGRGAAAVRIAQVRRIGAASSVPPALRRPGLRDLERDERSAGTGPQLLLWLEWKSLPQP